MKNLLKLFLIFVCLLNLCACGKKDDSESMLNATDIFQTDFFENVTAIEYYGFDETTVTFTDTDKINDTLNLLKNAQYQLVESEDFIEGLYMFDFIMGEENVSIGIGLHEISIGGNQYRTEDNLSDEIINILEITLE